MYIKDKKSLTTGSKILIYLAKTDVVWGNMLFHPLRGLFTTADEFEARRKLKYQIQRLKKKGWIKSEYKNAKEVLRLTKKGHLEALFAKAMEESTVISKKIRWGIVIFDIPEKSRNERALLRSILKNLGFKTLQASVWISPRPLSKYAYDYLEKIGLKKYISFIEASKISNEHIIKKAFKSEFDGRQI